MKPKVDKRQRYVVRLPESMIKRMQEISHCSQIDISWGQVCEEAIQVYLDKLLNPAYELAKSAAKNDKVLWEPGGFYWLFEGEGNTMRFFPNLESKPEIYLRSVLEANSAVLAIYVRGESLDPKSYCFIPKVACRQLVSLGLICEGEDTKGITGLSVSEDKDKFQEFLQRIDISFHRRYLQEFEEQQEKRNKERELEIEQHWRKLESLDENESRNGLVSAN